MAETPEDIEHSHIHVRVPPPSVPCILAVDWKEGMAIPPETLVSLNGLTYFNEKPTGYNYENPAESALYSKALVGAKLIKHLINYYGA